MSTAPDITGETASGADCAVAVISKLPRRGQTKTRLARTLGDQAALDLHRAFLRDELDALDQPRRWSLYLIHDRARDDGEIAELSDLLSQRARGLVPGGDGLAGELRGAFEQLLSRHDRVVIVSGDVPHIDPEVVAEALARLADDDVVLGSGPDGGYYLVGLKAPHDLFTPVRMSTRSTVQATVALARSLGLTVATVADLDDIDEAWDLVALQSAPAHRAARARAVVAGLERGEIALELPTELQIEVSSRCNLRCQACRRTHETLAPDADLTLADYRRIVAGLPRLSRITFQLNGEPLMCRDLFAMVAEARAAGVWTVVNTNGTLLGAARRREAIDSGLHELRISLDGARPETVAHMAGADIFAQVTRHVRALTEEIAQRAAQAPAAGHLPSKMAVSLWMIATRETLVELPELVALAADLGVDEVYVQRLVLTGQGVARPEWSLHGRVDAGVRDIVSQAEAVARQRGVALRASGRRPILESLSRPTGPNPWLRCWRPWRTATITASMRVLPCCISSFTLGYDALMRGDLSQQDWPAIWNGERYRALRRGLLRGEPLPACQGCNLEWSL